MSVMELLNQQRNLEQQNQEEFRNMVPPEGIGA